jgi:hypothetical protein
MTWLNQSEVLGYGARKTHEHRQSPSASWFDHHVIELGVAEIIRHLAHGDRVLDVGCANGFSYLDQDQTISAFADESTLRELSNFASTHHVGTRVLKPLRWRSAKIPLEVADPNTEWNRRVARIPAASDYGIRKLFVFQKL